MECNKKVSQKFECYLLSHSHVTLFRVVAVLDTFAEVGLSNERKTIEKKSRSVGLSANLVYSLLQVGWVALGFVCWCIDRLMTRNSKDHLLRCIVHRVRSMFCFDRCFVLSLVWHNFVCPFSLVCPLF